MKKPLKRREYGETSLKTPCSSWLYNEISPTAPKRETTHFSDYTYLMDKREKLKGKALTACGGILKDPSRYPSREYKGMLVYFCNQECLREFEQDPGRFMSGKVVHPIGREK